MMEIKKYIDWKYRWWYLLGVLMVIHLVANVWWITINNGAVPWDSANHTFQAIKISERFKELDFWGAMKSSNYYPIFVYFLSSIPVMIVGPNIKFIEFLATVYLLITLGSVFYYIYLLTKSGKVAFFTTLFFSFSAVVYNQSRLFMLDIPSVGLLMFSLIFLLKSNHLKEKKDTIWFFVFAAFLGLTKWTALLFLLVPALFEFFHFIRSKDKSLILKNALIGSGVFLAIFCPWYIINFNDVIYLGKVYSAGDKLANPQNPLSWDFVLNYYRIFLYSQVTPLPALAFFFSFIVFLFMKGFRYKWFVVLILVVSYVVFTLIRNKDSRYTMQWLVFTSFIVSSVFEKVYLKRKILGSLLFTGLAAFMFGYYLLMTVRPESWEGYKFSRYVPIFGGLEFINVDDSLVQKYEINPWDFDKLIPDLVPLKQDGRATDITVVAEYYHFNPSNIRTYTKVAGNEMTVSTPDLPFLMKNFGVEYFPTQKDLYAFINSKDYMLVVEKNIGSPYLLNMKANQQLMKAVNGKTLYCRDFTFDELLPGGECDVEEGEILFTGSDVLADGISLTTGNNKIEGYKTVQCPWGCSFGILQQNNDLKKPTITALKDYQLPTGEKVTLYRIDKVQKSGQASL